MNDITLKQLYDEIVKNRKEIKNKIDATESRLLLRIEEVTNKLKEVEAENTILKEEIEELKRHNNKKNIIIFGLQEGTDVLTGEYLRQKIKQLVDVDVTEVDISNCYRLGNSINSPIKVEFNSYFKKQIILKNCYKLKGTNIRIAHDLTPIQQQENKILRKYLREAKTDKNNKCYIKQNKLHINQNTYTVEELLEIEQTGEDTEERSNSAPNTPTYQGTEQPETSEKGIVQNHQREVLSSKESQTPKAGPKTGTIKKGDMKDRLRLRSTNK